MTKLDKLFKDFDGDSKDHKISFSWGSCAGKTFTNRGLIRKIVDENSLDSAYIINSKMLEGIIQLVKRKSVVEFDEESGIYTVYNTIVPQIYGEGATEEEATDKMIEEAKEFVQDYDENIEVFSSIFNGIQQFIISYILLNLDDDNKIREILKAS